MIEQSKDAMVYEVNFELNNLINTEARQEVTRMKYNLSGGRQKSYLAVGSPEE